MFENRWSFEAEITTSALLHIGSGGTVTKERRESDGTITKFEANAVVTDHEGHAYLPGKAIKGALRSWLRHAPGVDGRLVEEVFGSEDARSQGFVGGKAEFCDAFAVKNPGGTVKLSKVGAELQSPYPNNKPPLHWDAGRLTITSAHTAIARTTKTVRDEKLYHEEFVPPGVTFKLVVTAQNLADDEAAFLLFALQGFGHPTFPVRLGAGEQNLRGAFSLDSSQIKISRLVPADLKEWFAKRSLPVGKQGWHVTGGGYDGLPSLQEDERRALQRRANEMLPTICPPNRLVIRLRLTFDPAFMVHDPTRGQANTGDDTVSDHRALLDAAGDLLLPADSFRGAFRSQAERILRTLGAHACDPQGPDACKAIHAKGEEETKLCPTCRLFGAAGWASTLQISDFTAVEGHRGQPKRQDFVAIDRFTGGVSGGKKFDAEPFWNPVLEGSITLELDRSEPWALGLIALTLRDLIEGDITFGFGAAKGYGACTACIIGATAPAQLDSGSHWEELKKWVGQPRDSGPWGGLDPEPCAGLLRTAIPRFERARETAPLARPAATTAEPTPSPTVAVSPAKGPTGTEFLNPYHFIPAKGTNGRHGDVDAAQFGNGIRPSIGHVTHDRYVASTHSGRVLCALTTLGPIVVGASQTGDDGTAKHVQPFEIEGQPAIPASTLKGLVASLAEAASNSALRVLKNTRLSLSIDRQRRPKGSVHGHFSKISPELLPFSRQRLTVSIAEQLFGFVEEVAEETWEGEAHEDLGVKALAGRVRFGFARLAAHQESPFLLEGDNEALLQILSSPRPPSPALYFGPEYISKKGLDANRETHIPLGRKVYLHRNLATEGNACWCVARPDSVPPDRLKQHLWVRPLRKDLCFLFHVDFDNLSELELGLLLFALRPTKEFRHKLGLGKPLGLGTVRLDPFALLPVARQTRYESWPVCSPRYENATVLGDLKIGPKDVAARYATEVAALPIGDDGRFAAAGSSMTTLQRGFLNVLDPDIRRAIELVGNPANSTAPVHYPKIEGQDGDERLYEWSVENERQSPPSGHQHLKPLDRNAKSLPTLHRISKPPGGHGRR